nr:immunoglobulin light chain junction region [Macaca mulatta]
DYYCSSYEGINTLLF